MLGTEIELQQVQNSIFNIEMVLKAWLQEQGGDKEQLHLLLPGDSAAGTTRTRRNGTANVWRGPFLSSSVHKVWRAGASDKPRPHPPDPEPGGEDGEHPRLPACH